MKFVESLIDLINYRIYGNWYVQPEKFNLRFSLAIDGNEGKNKIPGSAKPEI
jgi:hypothetical protein